MPRPKASDWEQDEAVINAGIRGFNALTEIPRIFRKNIPWLEDYEFHFCSTSELPDMLSQGWKFLDTDMFDGSEWNKAMPLRFNVQTEDGHIKYRENYLLIQHKDYRDKVRRLRNKAAETQFVSAVSASGQASREDPEYARMKKYADELTDMDTHRVQGTAASEPERE